jgi:hypothetical protein
LREAIGVGVIKLKKDEVKLLLVNRQTKTVLACLEKTRELSLSTHPLLMRFDVIGEVCKLFKDVELIPDAIHSFSMIHSDNIESLHFNQLIYFTRMLILPSEESCGSLAKAITPFGPDCALSFLTSLTASRPSADTSILILTTSVKA